MKIHSLKFKLTLIMAGVVTAVIALICVCNTVFFEKYYINDRLNLLRSSYEDLKTVRLDKDYTVDKVIDEIVEINSVHNIHTVLIDTNWNGVYGSHSNYKEMIMRYQSMIFGHELHGDVEIIEENDEFTIIKNYDRRDGFTYLEIYGTLEDGSGILMQITLDSIEENVRIFNLFIITLGGIFLVISIIVIYFIAAGFTKPIKELSNLAEGMSAMDFGIKYKGKDKSEIGSLGRSMNLLSDELEKNISELKEANIELQKDIEIKEQNEIMRREFISNVSHELKTPLAIIQGYAEGLKEGVSEDPDSFEYYCDVIMDETNKMNQMVKKLLTLNQIEFGNEPLNLEQIEINEFVEAIIKSNKLRMNQKNITIEFNRAEHAFVWFDSMQLEEVFVNYLSNAINHCSENGKIRIDITAENDSVQVNVFNTGKNIPNNEIERIWEKFYKIDKARTREYGGNGIGLSIVKAVLDKYNGKYGVNNLSDGVEFWFRVEKQNM